LAYANASTHLDSKIVLRRWRKHLQHSLQETRGQIEVFATPRLGGLELGSFALRAQTRGGGQGTTSLSGRIGLGNVTLGRIHGVGTFSTGDVGGDTPGHFNLSGSFTVGVPPLFYSWGQWAFGMERGFSASGYYLGIQGGPIGLNLGDPEPRNVTDKVAFKRLEIAYTLDEAQRARASSGTLSVFEASPSVGFTYFSGSTIFSAGISPASSSAGASLGPYIGLRFSTSFWANFYNNPQSGWHRLGPR
jgi:hypothetical protein